MGRSANDRPEDRRAAPHWELAMRHADRRRAARADRALRRALALALAAALGAGGAYAGGPAGGELTPILAGAVVSDDSRPGLLTLPLGERRVFLTRQLHEAYAMPPGSLEVARVGPRTLVVTP